MFEKPILLIFMKQFNSGILIFITYIVAALLFTSYYFTPEASQQVPVATHNNPALVQLAETLVNAVTSFGDAIHYFLWFVVYMALINTGYFIIQFFAKNIDSFQLFTLSLFSNLLSVLCLLLVVYLGDLLGIFSLCIPFAGVSWYLSKKAGVFQSLKPAQA